MPLDIQQIIIFLMGSITVAAIKILYDHYKEERSYWFSGPIKSEFNRENGELLVKLNFDLINGVNKDMSIWSAFLKIISNLRFPEYGTSYIPQNFKPINISSNKTEPINLIFRFPRPPNLKDKKDVKREEWINHGLHAELTLVDNKRNQATAPLFIYEGGLNALLERLKLVSPIELYFIIERGTRSWLEVGKLRGSEILKIKGP